MKKIVAISLGFCFILGLSLSSYGSPGSGCTPYASSKHEVVKNLPVFINDAVTPSALPVYGKCVRVYAQNTKVVNVSKEVVPVSNSPPGSELME